MKRFLAIFLSFVCVFSLVMPQATVLAAEVNENTEAVEETTASDSTGVYSITSVKANDNTVTVSWNAESEATLIVTVIDQKNSQNTKEKTIQTANDLKCGNSELAFDELPEYYTIEVVLADAEGKELCDKYIERRYTEEVQEIATASLDDFDSSLTIPLFTNAEGFTSFVVMQEGAKVIYAEEESVGLKKSFSGETGTPEYFLSASGAARIKLNTIKEGDVVAIIDNENKSFYHGGLTELDPETGMPVGDSSDYYEFSFIKVSKVNKTESGIHILADTEASADPSQLYQQIVFNTGSLDAANASFVKHFSFGNEGEGLSGEGDLELKLGAEFYYDIRWTGFDVYFSVTSEYKVNNFIIRESGSTSKDFDLASFPFGIPYLGDFAIKIKLDLEVGGKGEVNFNVRGAAGLTVGTTNNMSCDAPDFELNELSVEGSIGVGLGIALVGELLGFEAGGEITNGIEVTGKLSAAEEGSSTHPWHVCGDFKCLQGEISYKLTGSLFVNLRIKEFKKTFTLAKKKLSDYYWSFTFNTHALTECPYKGYQLVVTVKNQNGQLIENANINYTPLDQKYAAKAVGTTGADGKATLYIPESKETPITLTAIVNYGYGDITGTTSMKKEAKAETAEIVITIIDEYIVKFDANKPTGASHAVTGDMGWEKLTYNEDGKLAKNHYELAGWGFKEWNTEADGSGDSYADEATVKNLTTPTTAITLYAQWEPLTYEIEYRYTKGGNDFTAKRTYYYDSDIELLDYRDNTETSILCWKKVGTLGADPYYVTETYRNLCDFEFPSGKLVGYVLEADEIVLSDATVVVTKDYKPNTGLAGSIALEDENGTIFGGKDAFTEDSARPGHYKLNNQFGQGTYEIVIKVNDKWVETGKTLEVSADPTKANLHFYSITISDDQNAGAAGFELTENAVPGPEANIVLGQSYVTINTDDTKLETGTVFKTWESTYVEPEYFISEQNQQTVKIGGKTILEAKTRACEYEVIFEKNRPATASNSVSGYMYPVITKYGTNPQLPLNTLELKGWNFTGWNTKPDGSGDAYENGAVVTNLTAEDGAVVKFYAQWEPKEYTLTYHYTQDGEEKTKTEPRSYDSAVQLFDYRESNEDTLLEWKKVGALGAKPYYLTETYWNLCDFSADGELTGYTFEADELFINDAEVLITLDNQAYTDFAGSLGLMGEDQVVFSGKDLFEEDKNHPGLYKLNKYFEYGTFELLIKSSSGWQHTGEMITVDENPESLALHYYSIWLHDDQEKDAAYYQLTENAYKGPEEDTVLKDSEISVGVDLTKLKEGTIFDIWENEEAVASDFEPEIADQTTTVVGPMKLQACTRACKYKIAFDANKPEGYEVAPTGTMSQVDVVCNADAELPVNTFALIGYKFAGWNTEANGKGKAYENGGLVNNLTVVDGETVTLYAQWKADEYKFIEGMNGSWKKGTKQDLRFKTDGEYILFEKLLIDGKVVDAANYKLESGSTIITLKAEYLEKMSKGTHTIVAVYKNGSKPDTSFTIKQGGTPDTWDSACFMLYMMIVIIAAGAILGIIAVRRRAMK